MSKYIVIYNFNCKLKGYFVLNVYGVKLCVKLLFIFEMCFGEEKKYMCSVYNL